MKSYLRILAFGRPWYRQGGLAFFFMLFQEIFSIFSLALLIPFLEIIFNQQHLSLPADPTWKESIYYELGQWVATFENRFGAVAWIVGAMAVMIVLKNGFRYMGSFYIAPLEQGVINNMRKRLFSHLTRLSMSFYTGKRKGNIINVVVTDVQIVQESVIGTLQNVLRDPLTMVFILTAMILVSWQLLLFTICILPVTAYFISRIGKSLKRKAHKSQDSLGGLISVLEEFISGVRIVKAFSREGYERKRYRSMNDDYQHHMVGLKRRSDLASPLTEVIAVLVLVIIILFGTYQIEAGNLNPPELIFFIAMFGQFLGPIKTFSSALARIQRGLASFQRVESFLDIPEDVKESEKALPLPQFSSEIEYRDVSFSYEEEEVLSHIDLTLKKGETIALVGPSGGGKSTLADLLPRFYDVKSGGIYLDGKDIRDLKVDDLRGNIGMVTQEGILFNDSVLRNIAYGEEQPDIDRVKLAAKVANAEDFISTMKDGLNTVIGERGTKLSGGQRQRISIARAVYKNAPILVLDEATSALDSESERLVQEALDKLMEEKTSIVIAHRLSTILNADRIYVIDKGQIVESGTHQDLIQNKGLYRSLYELQFNKN